MGRQIDRIDGLSSSTAVKGPCRVATTANITLSDLQTIDGVELADGDRVLVRAQTDARLNGIYRVSTGLWQRTKDFSSNRDVRKGTRIVVTDGITYATSEWIVTADNPVVFDASEITFSQIFFSTGSDVTITGVGVIVKETLSDLNAVTPTDENFGGRVLDDPDPSNNGDYYRQASAWVKGADLQRYNLSRLTITGGTVNAIEATTDDGVNPYSAVGFFIDIPDGDENTGAVTIAINGDAPISALDWDDSEFDAGYFRGRMLLSNETTSLKNLDPAAISAREAEASATAAAQSATDAATSAASVEYPVSYGVAQGLTPAEQAQARANIGITKGSDIASAATLTLPGDGNYHVVTGTTTANAISTAAEGTEITLRFAASLTLTHNATSLILLGGANRTTAAGDIGVYVSEGSGNWREVSYHIAANAPGEEVRGDIDQTGKSDAWKAQARENIDAGIREGGVVATTSGTAISIADIPSGVRRINIVFSGLSMSGSGNAFIEVGDSGGYETSGYVSSAFVLSTGTTSVDYAAAFLITQGGSSGSTFEGIVALERGDNDSNTWAIRGALTRGGGGGQAVSSGRKSLSGELTGFRLGATSSNTFDGGSMTYSWEF